MSTRIILQKNRDKKGPIIISPPKHFIVRERFSKYRKIALMKEQRFLWSIMRYSFSKGKTYKIPIFRINRNRPPKNSFSLILSKRFVDRMLRR